MIVLRPHGPVLPLSVGAPVLDAVALDAATGGLLLCVATPSAVEVFDLASRARVRSFRAGAGQPTRLAATHLPAGLAWGDESGGLHVWHQGSPEVFRWQRHRKAIHQLEPLRLGGGELLATGADDRYVYLTDPWTGAVTAACHPHIDWLEGMVTTVGPDGRGYALTVDHRRIATWTFDGAGTVVDSSAADLERVSAWTAWWSTRHAAPVFAATTEDHRLLLSVGGGRPELLDLSVAPVAVAAAGGGRRLAVAGADGSIMEIRLRSGGAGPPTLATASGAELLSLQTSPVHDGYLGLDTSGAVLSMRPEQTGD
ncbi:hypothetical protein [Dactylosporangium sp. NPDC005555]|uniref:hypothetical protein n=1 Tax=Dactylosporangium sp. NPDC005555 TaxID=3154889 RepID=UPI00339DD0E8